MYDNLEYTGYAPESLCRAEVFCSCEELASETRCEDVKIEADRFIFLSLALLKPPDMVDMCHEFYKDTWSLNI